jgi:hypothetical protein
MPLVVEFCQGRPSTIRQECGPYRVVEVKAEAILAFEGFQPFIIATRTPRGRWVLNGLDGLEFDYFLVLPPRDQARAEFDALLDSSQEEGDVDTE